MATPYDPSNDRPKGSGNLSWPPPPFERLDGGAGDPVPEHAAGGFGVRFAGRLIDMVVSMASGCVAGGFAGVFLGVLTAMGVMSSSWQTETGSRLMTNVVVGMFATIGAHTFAEGVAGTSVGKLVLGYRVVMVATGEPCTMGAALLRTLAYFVDSFFFGLPALSAMSDSALKQRIGDKWAGSAVIRADALPATGKQGAGRVAIGLIGGFLISGVISAGAAVLMAL